MTPARLAWWSRVLRVKAPIRDASDLRTRLLARFVWLVMVLLLTFTLLVGLALFASGLNDCGKALVNQTPLEARVHALETQVAEIRDGGHR